MSNTGQCNLEITDRKKDIIVNDKGDNVSPARVEGILTLEPEISQAMIYGDRKPYLSAILVPDADWFSIWCKENGKDDKLADMIEDPDLYKALSDTLGRINKRVSNIERIRVFAIAPEAFTIENEQMTPTMKIRRHVIARDYGDIIEGFY